jgi:hypothetical protein
MYEILYRALLGFLLGAVSATAYGMHAQSTSPYSSQQLMGETNLYGAILGLQTDGYIRDLQSRRPDYGALYGDRPCR